MTRVELEEMIDSRFKMFADGQITVEELQSHTRAVVSEFMDELQASVLEMADIMNKPEE